MNRFSRLPRQRKRRGYSLIESLIVISMSAVATGGSLVCISTMLKGERLTATAVQESQVVARLRQTWNEDAHLAQEMNVGSADQDGLPQCELSLIDGRKVRYHASKRGVVRQTQSNGGSAEQDVFQFAEGTWFQFHQVEQPRLARLKVIRPAIDANSVAGSSSDSSPKTLGKIVMTFDAALGREARLVKDLQSQPEAK